MLTKILKNMRLAPLRPQRLCVLILFLIAECALAAPQTKPPTRIDRIDFNGVHRVPVKQAREWFGVAEKAAFNQGELQKAAMNLLKGYAAAGLPYTRIDSLTFAITPDSLAATVHVYIHEGGEIVTGKIELSGLDSAKAQELSSRFDTRPGKKFEAAKLETDLDDALTQLEKQGYPFGKFSLAAVKLDTTDDKHAALGMTWNTVTGPQLIIQEIRFSGNEVTQDKVLLRELRMKTGALYNYNKVAQIRPRLLKLGFFDEVYEPEVFLASKNEGGLIIRVNEGNASKFDGVLGYNPATEKEKGYVTGLIDISLGNLLGTGRSLLVHWQKRDRQSQDLKFYYKEPWVAGIPLTVGGGFEQLIQDTTYIQRDLAMDFSLPLYENFTAIAGIARNETSPDSLGTYLLGIPKSRTLNASFGIVYDTRDDNINPRSGAYYQTGIQSGRKTNLGPDDLIADLELRKKVDNKRLSLDIEFYTPLFKRQVLAVSLHGRQIRSNEKYIPVSDLYRLGGARTLRGYREDQFRGSSLGWTNMEYRYILGRRSRVFVFADTGYYYSVTQSGTQEDYKIGYGFGFRLETGLGIMGIDYGLGRGEGDGLFSGKIHVGIVNEF
ncbi:MAG TPA: POTRA domain-containing protein [bacterium]|nr:POTRA domain-containing protein [bacterium]HPN42629.1 POTRA domain-containing protein [bacterium]